MNKRLMIVGLGYSGAVVAAAAAADGWEVVSTTRGVVGPGQVAFAQAGAALPGITHLLMTAPPGEAGDPFLATHGAALPGGLRWAGYLSTTGVYGDRGGGWVDEATEPAPGQPRSIRRLGAELAWREAASGRFALDLFRVAGIYGPGRSVLDDLRSGQAQRTVKPGHAFGRIHVADIGRAVLAAMARPPEGVRVLNLTDDEAAGGAVVVAHGATLLGVPPPPERDYAQAAAGMSDMARSFWSENRRVGNAATKAALGQAWLYPTYREGLAAIMQSGG